MLYVYNVKQESYTIKIQWFIASSYMSTSDGSHIRIKQIMLICNYNSINGFMVFENFHSRQPFVVETNLKSIYLNQAWHINQNTYKGIIITIYNYPI